VRPQGSKKAKPEHVSEIGGNGNVDWLPVKVGKNALVGRQMQEHEKEGTHNR